MSLKLPKGKPRFERILFIGLAFVIQIVWYLTIFSEIVRYSPYLETIFTIASLVMIFYLIMKDESPAYRISWIIVIALMPILGGVLYFFMGNKRPTRSLRRHFHSQDANRKEALAQVPPLEALLAQRDPDLASLSHYLTQHAEAPLYTDNPVTYYPNGESSMEDLLTDLWAAEESIFIEFFIVDYGHMFDQIYQVLQAKAAQGVDVRFIYDDFGCITRLPNDFVERLAEDGIQAMKFNPVKLLVSLAYNTRDHRKFVIVDGRIAYTGGINLADEYINVKERFGYWKDTLIRVEGSSVWNYTCLFLTMWNAFQAPDDRFLDYFPEEFEAEFNQGPQGDSSQHSFIQPFGDTPLDSNPVGENTYRQILSLATDYVYIYTPYLVISYELQTALTLAAQRGVDVRLMTPGIPDKKLVFRMTRSYYRPLIEAGVRIFEYSPGFLHAKTFVSDNKLALVGTINLDYRSLYLHFETGTLLYYHPEIEAIKKDFLTSQAQSREIFLGDIRPTFFGGIWDAVLRVIAPFV